MTGARLLVIVERAYRGAVEVGYFDVLYQLLELHRQLGGADLLLRDHAATYALDSPDFRDALSALSGAGRPVRCNDPRGEVRRLVEFGVDVMVHVDDLARYRIGIERIGAGVRTIGDSDLDDRWFGYSQILYM